MGQSETAFPLLGRSWRGDVHTHSGNKNARKRALHPTKIKASSPAGAISLSSNLYASAIFEALTMSGLFAFLGGLSRRTFLEGRAVKDPESKNFTVDPQVFITTQPDCILQMILSLAPLRASSTRCAIRAICLIHNEELGSDSRR